MSGLMADLAMILRSLRTEINTKGLIGNLVRVADEVEVGGLVDLPAAKGGPWKSYLDYYRAILENRVSVMETDPRYQQNRRLVSCSIHYFSRCIFFSWAKV